MIIVKHNYYKQTFDSHKLFITNLSNPLESKSTGSERRVDK